MKFETILFAAAFLLLAIFSFPGNANKDAGKSASVAAEAEASLLTVAARREFDDSVIAPPELSDADEDPPISDNE